ncbi:glycoside hydrolase [Maridesulfovibrio zosterae]|uniref:glycoside hydrolase n=1 Tax=Maridesulfovibrio zosterae TaxID=82171 RepID=UPI00041C0C8E|nr:glycoside hydrolase [Maridesulfovibrio zosterae]
MKIYAIFHLNLMFSSIPEEDRSEVINRCYWPLLHLIEKYNFPLGVEASGITLEIIQDLAPAWIVKFKELLRANKAEFIGSGYGQIIGPLVPAAVNKANFRIGMQTSEKILGGRPEIALVNEQAWSAGLVSHYLETGYGGVFMDYDNPARFADWDDHIQHYPQRALGVSGESIPILWSRSMVFQKLQRFAHGELELPDYLNYVENLGTNDGWLPVYGNDAEIFDYRPGRYKTESNYSGQSEWEFIKEAFNALRDNGHTFFLPSEVLADLDNPLAGNKINLCSAEQPVPVKKQRKYNLTRWAVSGRNDFQINSLCKAISTKLEKIPATPASEKMWKELCFCWSSDFRTHITQKRFDNACRRLQYLALYSGASVREPEFVVKGRPLKIKSRHCRFETEQTSVVLNTAKGLAIHEAAFSDHDMVPVFGTLEHGYFKDIALGADFFSGHLIMEGPGVEKETDLYHVAPLFSETNESIDISCEMNLHSGRLEKSIKIHKQKQQIDILYRFKLENVPQGYIRLGHITLLTQNFDYESSRYEVSNGGGKEEFSLKGKDFDHSNNVSFLVSSAHASGMTDSRLVIGGQETALEISPLVDEHAFIAMVTCRQAVPTPFIRVAFSMQEMDETSRHNACDNTQFIFSTGFSIKPYSKAGSK